VWFYQRDAIASILINNQLQKDYLIWATSRSAQLYLVVQQKYGKPAQSVIMNAEGGAVKEK